MEFGWPELMRLVKNGEPMSQKIQPLFIDDLDGSEAEGTVASIWTAPNTRST